MKQREYEAHVDDNGFIRIYFKNLLSGEVLEIADLDIKAKAIEFALKNEGDNPDGSRTLSDGQACIIDSLIAAENRCNGNTDEDRQSSWERAAEKTIREASHSDDSFLLEEPGELYCSDEHNESWGLSQEEIVFVVDDSQLLSDQAAGSDNVTTIFPNDNNTSDNVISIFRNRDRRIQEESEELPF